MSDFNRRNFLKDSAGVAAAAPRRRPRCWRQGAGAGQSSYKPEKGAKLRVLRWKPLRAGRHRRSTCANIKKFTEATGVEVRVDNEGWEDVRPKAAVAANAGAGPDIILSTSTTTPTCIPDKLLDVTDLADYLGKKYGGWYPACAGLSASPTARWIGMPLGVAGNAHRATARATSKAAGFDGFPKDTDGFLKLCKALKAKGTPGGFALGNATGDGNNWAHWLVWAFGGKLVDENNKVVIDSPETIKALEYAKELYADLHPRHAVLARPEQQQGVPRRPDHRSPTTASRSTTRRRTRRTRS